jgi:hypothetical protein
VYFEVHHLSSQIYPSPIQRRHQRSEQSGLGADTYIHLSRTIEWQSQSGRDLLTNPLDLCNRYYHPLAGTLEAVLPATDYGLAAFVFRKDLREMLGTVMQLLKSVERDSEVRLNAKQTALALYYVAA